MGVSGVKAWMAAGILAGLALWLPSAAQGQQAFAGILIETPRAEATPAPGYFFVRHLRRTPKREYLGVKPLRGDAFYQGMMPVPRGARLRYKTLLVRHADGEMTLWVDSNRDGRFEPDEGVPFDSNGDQGGEPGGDQGRAARFRVELPAGGFRPVEMQAWMAGAGDASAEGERIRIAYTATMCVAGHARVNGRMLSMCFEYDPATQQASLARGLEWVGGDRVLRANGRPPVFRFQNLTLQAATLDVKTRAFVVVSVPERRGSAGDAADGARGHER